MIINGREIDRSKDLLSISDIDELRDYLIVLFQEIARCHPKYPEYEYTYEDGKLLSIKRHF